mmetsp:Transcript_12889/g.35604  ORF Transcript_12889/g.35604 Transcript_12889/m.35604 type:complete len:94 (+) Transcript_12889:100-381(+)
MWPPSNSNGALRSSCGVFQKSAVLLNPLEQRVSRRENTAGDPAVTNHFQKAHQLPLKGSSFPDATEDEVPNIRSHRDATLGTAAFVHSPGESC